MYLMLLLHVLDNLHCLLMWSYIFVLVIVKCFMTILKDSATACVVLWWYNHFECFYPSVGNSSFLQLVTFFFIFGVTSQEDDV